MGNISACSSFLASLSKEDVAFAVAAQGAKYEKYADAVRDNGVDGEILASLESQDKLAEIFEDLQITSKLHRKVLAKTLSRAKRDQIPETSDESSHEPQEDTTVVENPSFFQAAAAFELTVDTPADEVEEFEEGCSGWSCLWMCFAERTESPTEKWKLDVMEREHCNRHLTRTTRWIRHGNSLT